MVFQELIAIVVGAISVLFSPILGYSVGINWIRFGCCMQKSFQLVTFDLTSSEEIFETMRPNPTSASLGIYDQYSRLDPNNFQGVWWMDGNPAPEVLATTADMVFNIDGESPTNARLPTLALEGGTWSYNNNIPGRVTFFTQCVIAVNPQFILNDDKDRFIYQGLPEDGPPLTFLDEHTYTKPIPPVGDYTLRRIIDGTGAVVTSNWGLFQSYVNTKLSNNPRLITYRGEPDSDSCLLKGRPNDSS